MKSLFYFFAKERQTEKNILLFINFSGTYRIQDAIHDANSDTAPSDRHGLDHLPLPDARIENLGRVEAGAAIEAAHLGKTGELTAPWRREMELELYEADVRNGKVLWLERCLVKLEIVMSRTGLCIII